MERRCRGAKGEVSGVAADEYRRDSPRYALLASGRAEMAMVSDASPLSELSVDFDLMHSESSDEVVITLSGQNAGGRRRADVNTVRVTQSKVVW